LVILAKRTPAASCSPRRRSPRSALLVCAARNPSRRSSKLALASPSEIGSRFATGLSPPVNKSPCSVLTRLSASASAFSAASSACPIFSKLPRWSAPASSLTSAWVTRSGIPVSRSTCARSSINAGSFSGKFDSRSSDATRFNRVGRTPGLTRCAVSISAAAAICTARGSRSTPCRLLARMLSAMASSDHCGCPVSPDAEPLHGRAPLSRSNATTRKWPEPTAGSISLSVRIDAGAPRHAASIGDRLLHMISPALLGSRFGVASGLSASTSPASRLCTPLGLTRLEARESSVGDDKGYPSVLLAHRQPHPPEAVLQQPVDHVALGEHLRLAGDLVRRHLAAAASLSSSASRSGSFQY
jgi:hypothetical protein